MNDDSDKVERKIVSMRYLDSNTKEIVYKHYRSSLNDHLTSLNNIKHKIQDSISQSYK